MTTGTTHGDRNDGGGGSRFWHSVIAVFLRTTPRPIVQFRRRSPTFPVQEVAIIGRRSGLERRLFLGLITVGDTRYVGSSNGTTNWTRNLAAAGTAEVITFDGRRTRMVATELERGPERTAVIDAVCRAPFPAGPMYRLARRHVEAVGRYFEIAPTSDADQAASPT